MAENCTLKVDPNAWCAEPGPILLLAGPGTGKTHQLALRIKFLVEKRQIPAEAIAVITFTREAAQNMRRRISDEEKDDVFVPYELRPQRIMTMHGLGLEIVRAYAAQLNLPDNFNVMTDSRLQSHLFRDAAFLAGRGEREAQEAARQRQRSKPIEPDSSAAQIISSYETILRACRVIDYDDQIRLACKLLAEKPEVKAKYKTLQHILVDEYQDINADQRQLIELLSFDSQSGLFAVGDDDQSVYDFRGGNPKYIRQFAREFGDKARVLCLDESRRCPETVIRAGIKVLETFDPARIAKPDPKFSEKKKAGRKVRIHSVPSDDDEAEIIARLTARALPKNRVLILVPAKQYAEKIKRALRRRQISYTHPPSLEETGLLLLREVHDWARAPELSLALRRCIEALCQAGTVNIPSARVRKEEQRGKRAENLKQLANLWHGVTKEGVSLWHALQAGANAESPFLAEVHSKLKAIQESVAGGVGDFLKTAADTMQPWSTTESLVEEVDAWIAELRGHAQQSEGEVRIMTLQSAKGLEAEVVFVVGLNDGIFPRKDCDKDQVAEAARLFYVSMTRAISELHLFHARKRDGSITFLKESFALKPSRFINSIEKAHKEEKYYPAHDR
jgi:superfamily I DNA/RNA helicase